MATLTLEGRSFEIAPYKIGALRRVAPHIDAINESSFSIDTLEGMIENAGHIIAIIAIGLQKIDAQMTAEVLEDMIGIDEIRMLTNVMSDIMKESGLSPKGETEAPSTPASEGASTENSGTSSVS